MTQNVHIRFVGSADLAQVHREIGKVTKDVAALSAAIQSGATAGGARSIADVKWLDNFKKSMAAQRSVLNSSILALDDFGVKSVKVADHIDTLTERIRAQKFGLSDLVREHKNLRDVYRQQLANRQAMTMEWSRNGDGSANVDVITRNRNAAEFNASIRNWRTELGMYNQVLASVADNTVKWGKNTQWAGRQMTAGLSMPLLAAAAGTGALAYEIDKGLTQIVKVYGDAETALTTSDAAIKASSMETVRNLAAAYGQSAKDTLEITAQLAATGRVGAELQEDTKQVSRARLLGELDLQEAMKATTTLQSVYNMSSKELADTFNYMNSMENQTVLTMQDFVVGIPKVTGVIKELGGNVQTTGTLLAAMKIAGIDAAEGANAIKSISFKTAAQTVGAKDMFQQLTGQTYEEVVGQTTDVTERLIRIGEAMRGIEPADRVGLIAKMFGLYQGSKALSIIGQLTDGSEQMSRALDVGRQSAEEWGATAERELSKLTGSNWNKLQQQWQSLKVTLAEVGDVFLGMAIPIVEWFGNVVEGFNSLDDGTKKWIARLALAAAAFGPIVMFAGLLGNMIGSIGKLTSFVVNMVAPLKMMTAEEKAAADISRLKRKVTNDEARAYAILAEQIRNATDALNRDTVARHKALGIPMPGRNQPRGPDGRYISKDDAARIAAETAKTNSMWSRISGHVGTYAILGTAAAASMSTESGTLLGNISDVAFMIAAIGPMLGGIPWRKVAQGASSAFSKVTNPLTQWFDNTPYGGTKGDGFFKRNATKMKDGTTGMLANLRSMLPAIGAVTGAMAAMAVAGGAAIYVINKGVSDTRKEMQALGGSAEAYAKTLGFAYTEMGEQADAAGNKVETLRTKTQKFAEENADAARALQQFRNWTPDQQMQMAIGEGLKASLHGATAEQAIEAAKIALKTMGSKLSEEEMTAKIKAQIDFGDMDAVIDAKIKDIQSKLNVAASGQLEQSWSENVFRFINQGMGGETSRLNFGGEEMAKTQAQDMLDMLNAASEEALPGMIETMNKAGEESEAAFFNSLFNPAQRKEWAAKGVESMDDIMKMVDAQKAKEGPGRWGGKEWRDYAENAGIPPEAIDRLQAYSDARATMVQELAAADQTLTDAQRATIYTMEDYLRVTGRLVENDDKLKKAQEGYAVALGRRADSGKEFSEAEKLALLNAFRLAAGLPRATSVLQGFGTAAEAAAGKLRYLSAITGQVGKTGVNFATNISFTDTDQALNALKDTYSGAMDTIYDAAAATSEATISRAMEGIGNHYDSLREKLDRQQKASADSFDKQVKQFDRNWENKMDAFAEKWDKRKEATEAKYDTQIQKIKDAIKAEEDAEKVRQRIFEAEQTRLSRLAELQNRGIDFNRAITTGNVDEAAKISNDMAATSTGWALEDAAAAGGTESEARRAALEGKIDALEKQKDAALQRLDEQEEAEKKALERAKDRERELLDAKRKAAEEAFAVRKKNLDKEEAEAKRSKEEQVAIRRMQLDAELAALRAFVPRDQAEMNAHIEKIKGAYARFGVTLDGNGKQWSKAVGNALTQQMEITRAKEANTAAWDALGRVIAENMTKGAFNMTLAQFIRWVSTGEMPANAGVGYKGKAARQQNGKWVYGTQGGVTMHEGGIIGQTSGKRTGYTGGSLSNSERLTNTLVGEAVLNRRATRALGEDFIHDVNRFGGIPRPFGIGGPNAQDMNINAVLGTNAVVAGFRQGIGSIAERKAQMSEAAASGAGGNAYPVDMGAIYPGGWKRPATGPVTSRYGMRFHPILKRWKLHGGSDIGAPTGTPVRSARGGRVTFAGNMGSYGKHIVISHGGGLATTYSHLSQIGVNPGQSVGTGRGIGAIGSTGRSTGPHLHFEYMKGGKRLNPNLIIPGLDTGAFIIKDGLAQLHEGERVLTKPNTKDLDEGLQKMSEGGGDTITVQATFTGPINGIDDLERGMIEVMERIENRKGAKKKVGGRR